VPHRASATSGQGGITRQRRLATLGLELGDLAFDHARPLLQVALPLVQLRRRRRFGRAHALNVARLRSYHIAGANQRVRARNAPVLYLFPEKRLRGGPG
jgi:hypothetical protein